MAFPSSPSNGQQAVVNNSTYTYNSTKGTWTLVPALSTTTSIGIFSNVTVSTALVIPSGNTAVRANTGVTTGTMRLNTDSGNLEVYYTNANGSAWFSAVNLYTGPKATSTASVTANGSYTIHTFTTAGIFTANQTLVVDYLVVAGGGGGGGWAGGGGGAGGV